MTDIPSEASSPENAPASATDAVGDDASGQSFAEWISDKAAGAIAEHEALVQNPDETIDEMIDQLLGGSVTRSQKPSGAREVVSGGWRVTQVALPGGGARTVIEAADLRQNRRF